VFGGGAEGLHNDPTGKLPIVSDTFGMVTWLNKTTLKRRFFLINTQQSGSAPGHTMAAGKNRMGLIRFFDPNGGIVSAWTASKMETFMREYFSTRKVFWAYRVRGTVKLQLDLEKYTPAKWGPSGR
jgi:Yersinia/Haemophilus virulence surface antigen